MAFEKLLDHRPDNIKRKLGRKSKVCLLNSHDIFKNIRSDNFLIMACNTRIKHVIPGIMKAAMETDSIVAFELAKSESDFKGGYTGMTPKDYWEIVVAYAEETGFDRPFFIHADHMTVKTNKEEEIKDTEALIADQLDVGYTSFALDASFNPEEDNIEITARMAKPIVDRGLGLETEVGEIKSVGQTGEITTVEEARTFIEGLKQHGFTPDLLGINNGSKHGNYLEGEEISIDLERTGQCYEAVKGHGVNIAQHGITGTPLHLVGRFADYGIRKGNVGTEWQNIAHRHLPADLMNQMKTWAKNSNKDIKLATKQFLKDINSIPESLKKSMAEESRKTATEFFKSFRSVGSASLVARKIAG
ncbi:MAG: fructose-bisphosphate aldolase [candidate division Zixibacteria bacterium RBG_16_53_22]|nr:MAG: fructose-bisphosphate aldolase [candidate division Zixibacteria bacterium RBG_16_53_22]